MQKLLGRRSVQSSGFSETIVIVIVIVIVDAALRASDFVDRLRRGS